MNDFMTRLDLKALLDYIEAHGWWYPGEPDKLEHTR